MQYKLLQIIQKIFNVFIEIKKIVSIIISTRYRRVLIIAAAILQTRLFDSKNRNPLSQRHCSEVAAGAIFSLLGVEVAV